MILARVKKVKGESILFLETENNGGASCATVKIQLDNSDLEDLSLRITSALATILAIEVEG